VRPDRTPVTVTLILALIAAYQLVRAYPLMPDPMAVHFSIDGVPNGWNARTSFFILYASIEAALAVLALALPTIARRIPDEYISIPYRGYWLAPERRERTLAFLWAHTSWLFTITLAFQIAVAHAIIRANIDPSKAALTPDFLIVLVAFMGGVGYLSLRILTRFRKPTV
jgi:serine/threonine-protein kinase